MTCEENARGPGAGRGPLVGAAARHLPGVELGGRKVGAHPEELTAPSEAPRDLRESVPAGEPRA